MFDDSLCFEGSYSHGARVFLIDDLAASSDIIYALDTKKELDLQKEEDIYLDLLRCCAGKPYDLMGAIYLGWRLLLKKLFKTPIPKTNPMGGHNRYFCTELIDALGQRFAEHTGIKLFKEFPDIEMVDAWKLCQELLHSEQLKEVGTHFGD
jgi:hypothetical protein